MTKEGYRAVSLFMACLVTSLVIIQWKTAWQATYAKWDVRDARVALRRITNNRSEALDGEIRVSVSCLREIMNCYTNWNWKRGDLMLGPCVEEQRKAAVQDVVRSLRSRTGREFGNDPEEWIRGLELSIGNLGPISAEKAPEK
jgi:hypothetical protein